MMVFFLEITLLCIFFVATAGSTTSSPSHQQNHRPEGEEHVPDTSTSKPVVSKPFTKATYNTSTVPAAENILPQTTENKQIGTKESSMIIFDTVKV